MSFKWEKLQKYYGYSDEEMDALKSDPHKGPATQKLFSPEIAKKYLIIRVVSSHGCSAGMRVGDMLVFRALGVLMPEKSSPWCSQAMGEIGGFANMAQDRFVSGLDPDDMTFKYFSCMDAGSKCGWGQVAMRADVVDQEGFEELFKKRPTEI
ncbi:MAG: hypothetical protein C4582_11295 [Desulfobacteraceae bacterium]|jgi:uncharacterized repeat protein (TIGR04076 family)|nr:MAG: hypothetical protein C4582_11295 [Desulfobacteraceae bacterium]